jgi:hypothetical protein
MTTRRTVDSKAGTLKTMSKLTGKSAVAKLFTFAAMGLMAVSTMSFAQKDDTATGYEMEAVKAETIISDSNVDVVTSKFDANKLPKVVLSEEFVNALRNIKLDVAKADREVIKSLYRNEMAKRNAVAFYQNSKATVTEAEAEVAEAMKFETLKYTFNIGNTAVMEDANEEVDYHMNLSAVKLTVNTAMKMDMINADEEVLAGVTEKSPETAVATFMKSTTKDIADADAEISNTLKTKNTITKK